MCATRSRRGRQPGARHRPDVGRRRGLQQCDRPQGRLDDCLPAARGEAPRKRGEPESGLRDFRAASRNQSQRRQTGRVDGRRGVQDLGRFSQAVDAYRRCAAIDVRIVYKLGARAVFVLVMRRAPPRPFSRLPSTTLPHGGARARPEPAPHRPAGRGHPGARAGGPGALPRNVGRPARNSPRCTPRAGRAPDGVLQLEAIAALEPGPGGRWPCPGEGRRTGPRRGRPRPRGRALPGQRGDLRGPRAGVVRVRGTSPQWCGIAQGMEALKPFTRGPHHIRRRRGTVRPRAGAVRRAGARRADASRGRLQVFRARSSGLPMPQTALATTRSSPPSSGGRPSRPSPTTCPPSTTNGDLATRLANSAAAAPGVAAGGGRPRRRAGLLARLAQAELATSDIDAAEVVARGLK